MLQILLYVIRNMYFQMIIFPMYDLTTVLFTYIQETQKKKYTILAF